MPILLFSIDIFVSFIACITKKRNMKLVKLSLLPKSSYIHPVGNLGVQSLSSKFTFI